MENKAAAAAAAAEGTTVALIIDLQAVKLYPYLSANKIDF